MTVVLGDDQRLFGKISGDGQEIIVQPTDQSPPRRQVTGIVTGMEWKKSGHINIGWSVSTGNADISRAYGDAELIAQ